jgi:hypothetical protein
MANAREREDMCYSTNARLVLQKRKAKKKKKKNQCGYLYERKRVVVSSLLKVTLDMR